MVTPSSLPLQNHLGVQLDEDPSPSSASLRLRSPVPVSPHCPSLLVHPSPILTLLTAGLPPSPILTSLRWCSRIFTFFSLASSSPLPGAFSTEAPLCWTRTGEPLGLLWKLCLRQAKHEPVPLPPPPHLLKTLRSPAGHTGGLIKIRPRLLMGQWASCLLPSPL